MNGLQMPVEENVRDYREAADKVKQIGILADLNLCKKKQIAELLREQGETVDGRFFWGKKTATAGETPSVGCADSPLQEGAEEKEGLPCVMTVGALGLMLDALPPDVPVLFNGRPITQAQVLGVWDVRKDKLRWTLRLETEERDGC